MTDHSVLLRQRLESLPQGLYDEIYSLTFTAEPGERKICLPQYGSRRNDSELYPQTRLPERSVRFRGHDNANLFLVDRRSNRKFAGSYYGDAGAVFTFETGLTLYSWLVRLSDEHRSMITDMRCVVRETVKPDWIRS